MCCFRLLSLPATNGGFSKSHEKGNTDAESAPQDRAGNTPLHLAIESGHAELAVVLIEGGADRERGDSEGCVLLRLSSTDGTVPIR